MKNTMKAKETTTRVTNSSNQRLCRRGSVLHVLFLAIFAVGFFALLPPAQAVSPPPDGGYPNFNTAEGQKALLSLTTGAANTAVGWSSLLSNAGGSFNTATGAGALLFNIADANTAFGAAALLSNTLGLDNTATGAAALLSNTEGVGNTATGFQALYSNTTGTGNTANGALALNANTIGIINTANGDGALFRNTTGIGNTAIGAVALQFNTTGSTNTALGQGAGVNVTTANNVIAIGHDGLNVDFSCFIGHIRGITPGLPDAVPVVIDSAGQLGTQSSSRRYKKELKAMDSASEAILALKPVTFHYKSDNAGTPQFGLIAEEVAEVNPDLVVRDQNGEIYTVRYDAVNAMLLNEFLKEHRKVEEQNRKLENQHHKIGEQEATITRLKKQMETVVARLSEHDSKIQKVSAQVEVSEFASRTAGRIRGGGPTRQMAANQP